MVRISVISQTGQVGKLRKNWTTGPLERHCGKIQTGTNWLNPNR